MLLRDYPSTKEIAALFRRTEKQIQDLNDRLNALLEKISVCGQADNINLVQSMTRIASLESALKEADTKIAVIHEPFADTRGLDAKALNLPAAQVFSDYNILTLRSNGGAVIQPRHVRIVGGNGLPGNKHQVHPETGMYFAREGIYNNLLALVDGNIDTWMEYERIVALPGIRYMSTVFSEGLSWLEQSWLPLELEVEMEMDDLSPVGGLTVSPFLPPLPGYQPACMMAAINDGRGARQYLDWAPVSANVFLPCLPQPARYIRTVFRQNSGVKATIALPDKPLSLAVAGVDYDSSGQIKLPSYDTTMPVSPQQEMSLISKYYNQPARKTAPAVRYMIGLKEITPVAYTYEVESEFVSCALPANTGVVAIRLDGSYEVPRLVRDERLVRWSLSFDDGASWLEVAANDADAKAYNLPREVRFSSYTPVFLRNTRAIHLPTRPESVRVKIHLRRPVALDLSEYLTPVVKEYTLILEEA